MLSELDTISVGSNGEAAVVCEPQPQFSICFIIRVQPSQHIVGHLMMTMILCINWTLFFFIICCSNCSNVHVFAILLYNIRETTYVQWVRVMHLHGGCLCDADVADTSGCLNVFIEDHITPNNTTLFFTGLQLWIFYYLWINMKINPSINYIESNGRPSQCLLWTTNSLNKLQMMLKCFLPSASFSRLLLPWMSFRWRRRPCVCAKCTAPCRKTEAVLRRSLQDKSLVVQRCNIMWWSCSDSLLAWTVWICLTSSAWTGCPVR